MMPSWAPRCARRRRNSLLRRRFFVGGGVLFDLALFLGRDVDFVHALRRALEVLDGTSQRIADLRKLSSTEDDEDDEQNQNQFAKAKAGHAASSVLIPRYAVFASRASLKGGRGYSGV